MCVLARDAESARDVRGSQSFLPQERRIDVRPRRSHG
jgi:hypothetical protein